MAMGVDDKGDDFKEFWLNDLVDGFDKKEEEVLLGGGNEAWKDLLCVQ